MACLYNSMKACGLQDVDAVRAQYNNTIDRQLEHAMNKQIRDIVRDDPTLDQHAMGSVNFLQLYCHHHPDIAFILTYTPPQSSKTTEWILVGSLFPRRVVRIAHSGSVNNGHFEARVATQSDLRKSQNEWTRRQ